MAFSISPGICVREPCSYLDWGGSYCEACKRGEEQLDLPFPGFTNSSWRDSENDDEFLSRLNAPNEETEKIIDALVTYAGDVPIRTMEDFERYRLQFQEALNRTTRDEEEWDPQF
jgi:hypothetical protein